MVSMLLVFGMTVWFALAAAILELSSTRMWQHFFAACAAVTVSTLIGLPFAGPNYLERTFMGYWLPLIVQSVGVAVLAFFLSAWFYGADGKQARVFATCAILGFFLTGCFGGWALEGASGPGFVDVTQ